MKISNKLHFVVIICVIVAGVSTAQQKIVSDPSVQKVILISKILSYSDLVYDVENIVLNESNTKRIHHFENKDISILSFDSIFKVVNYFELNWEGRIVPLRIFKIHLVYGPTINKQTTTLAIDDQGAIFLLDGFKVDQINLLLKKFGENYANINVISNILKMYMYSKYQISLIDDSQTKRETPNIIRKYLKKAKIQNLKNEILISCTGVEYSPDYRSNAKNQYSCAIYNIKFEINKKTSQVIIQRKIVKRDIILQNIEDDPESMSFISD